MSKTGQYKIISPLHGFFLLLYTAVALYLGYHACMPFIAERYFREGVNETLRKRYHFAIDDLEQAVKYAPWETHYRVQLGKAYEEYAKYHPKLDQRLAYLRKAEHTYKNIVNMDPLNPWYVNRVALIYIEYSNLLSDKKAFYIKKVDEYTRKAAMLDKKNPLFQLNYASFLHTQGRVDEAIAYYEFVIQADNRMGEAYYNLADIYRQKNNTAKPLELYLALYKHNPSFTHVRLAIASTLMQLNREKEAIPYLEESIAIKKEQWPRLSDKDKEATFLEPLKTLASIYMQAEDWQRAASSYDTYTSYKDLDRSTHPYYIQALINSNQALKALVVLQQRLEAFPRDELAKKQYDTLTDYMQSKNKR